MFQPGFARRLPFALTVAVLFSSGCAPAAAELVLVENGVSRAPIVVFENAPPFTRRAADELAGYLEKASGARPPVLEGCPDPLPARAIWVGYQPALVGLFPGIDFDFKHPEEILVAANENHLVIAGRDRWLPDHLEVHFPRRTVNGIQQEYGTVNAVYTFLQDYLGVRWLWPGEPGEDIPARATVAFAPFEYRYHPQLRSRADAFPVFSIDRQLGGHEWARFNRVQLDSLTTFGGHGFIDWWARFHETNPEYFALQPDGTRNGFPSPGNAKICEANPAAWEQWLADVAARLTEQPTLRVFNAAANDGWMSGHCICPDCRAWDRLDAERRRFTWQGLSQEYVALADRQVTFANQLARRLKERFPGEDYYVSILAYGNSRPAPLGAVPDDNVVVLNVAHFFHDLSDPRYDSIGETERQSFIAWSKVAKNQIWRPNLGNWAGWKQGGPVDLGRPAENFRLLADTGCVGVSFDNVWMYWATQGPLYYLLAQLAWNPRADAAAVMDDYFRRGFGPAGAAVQEYYGLLERVSRAMISGGRAWGEAFDGDVFARAGRLLDQAETALTGAPEKYARRLAFVRAGCELLRLQTENRALVPALSRAGDKADAGDLALARANWAAMQALAKQHPMLWFVGYAFPELRPAVDPDFER